MQKRKNYIFTYYYINKFLVEKINLKLIKLSLLKIENKIDYIISRKKKLCKFLYKKYSLI